jgi:AbrB family looped-hinge helix DNA binding protein
MFKISSKGQITLPKKIREALKIGPGGKVDFTLERNEVKLRVVEKSQARALMGSLRKYARRRYEKEIIREATKEEVARAAARKDPSS